MSTYDSMLRRMDDAAQDERDARKRSERLTIATALMTALLTRSPIDTTWRHMAKQSLDGADALLEQLDK